MYASSNIQKITKKDKMKTIREDVSRNKYNVVEMRKKASKNKRKDRYDDRASD